MEKNQARKGYREYLQSILDDENFDLENTEDFQTWVEEEEEREAVVDIPQGIRE